MIILCLLHLATTATHGTANVTAYGSAVCLRALSARWKVSDVTDTSVRLDVLQSLDVLLNLSLKISFRLEAFDLATNLILLLGSEFRRLRSHVQAQLLYDLLCPRTPYAIDGGKRNFKALVFWECDT